jgi:hypothetical protein
MTAPQQPWAARVVSALCLALALGVALGGVPLAGRLLAPLVVALGAFGAAAAHGEWLQTAVAATPVLALAVPVGGEASALRDTAVAVLLTAHVLALRGATGRAVPARLAAGVLGAGGVLAAACAVVGQGSAAGSIPAFAAGLTAATVAAGVALRSHPAEPDRAVAARPPDGAAGEGERRAANRSASRG